MGITLEKNSDKPLYLQLSDGLISEIQSGNSLINTMLPSERTLMKMYDVSRATVRQALDRLARLGYLRKEHGRGNFVALPGMPGGFIGEVGGEMRVSGRKVKAEVIFFRIVLCEEDTLTMMGLAPNDYVFKFSRLYTLDGEPLLHETTFLPYSGFEGLNKEDIEKAPLSEIITVWYRKAVTMTEESFALQRLDSRQAKLLGAEGGCLAMRRERRSLNGDCVVEYSVGHTLDERVIFHTVTKK